MKHLFLILCTTLAPLFAFASSTDSIKTVNPVSSAFMLEVGSSHLADTYLTPLRYDGWHIGLSYQRRQAMAFAPEKWIMDLRANIAGDRTQNPVRNATMWALDIEAAWSMTHRWQMSDRLKLSFGPYTGINFGALYLGRNGNNPCAAKGAWEIGAQASASWQTTFLGRRLSLSYDVTCPLGGIFFTPDYGQLYYEIWLGERSGIISGIWPGNYFRVDNRLMADIDFGTTTLRLGYRCDIHSTKARGIVSRHTTHSAVIGIVCQWISLARTAKLTPSAKIITASY